MYLIEIERIRNYKLLPKHKMKQETTKKNRINTKTISRKMTVYNVESK